MLMMFNMFKKPVTVDFNKHLDDVIARQELNQWQDYSCNLFRRSIRKEHKLSDEQWREVAYALDKELHRLNTEWLMLRWNVDLDDNLVPINIARAAYHDTSDEPVGQRMSKRDFEEKNRRDLLAYWRENFNLDTDYGVVLFRG